MSVFSKKIYCLILLFLINSSVAGATGSIEVFAIDCRTNEERQLPEIEIFHNQHSYGAWRAKWQESWDGLTVDEQFEEGVYYIEYKSIFGKIERKKVTILNGVKQKVYLCMDKLNHKKSQITPLIDKLKNGEKYTIQNTFRGSIDYGIESVIIKKNNGVYYAQFKKRQKRLSKKEITLLRYFEIELNLLRNRRKFCSWANEFLLSYKQNRIEIIESSCEWNGWGYLLKKLGWKAFEPKKT